MPFEFPQTARTKANHSIHPLLLGFGRLERTFQSKTGKAANAAFPVFVLNGLTVFLLQSA